MNDTNGIDIYLTSINELENGWLEIRSFPFCNGRNLAGANFAVSFRQCIIGQPS